MWISVNDALPKDCKSVLIYTEKRVIRIAAIYPTLKKDHPYWLGDRPIELEYGKVTHWMPLPEPPKEV